MTKLSTQALTPSDIALLLKEKSSDFGFEMQTLAILQNLKASCQHGGTYVDPVTQKARQFDIRANVGISRYVTFHLAVECKNIPAHFPLVAHAMPRTNEEAFVEVLMVRKLSGSDLSATLVKQYTGLQSLYQTSGPVAKSLDRVARDQNGDPRLMDKDVFEAYSQAINSLYGMIAVKSKDRSAAYGAAFVPMMVIPNGSLWVLPYNSNGTLAGPATPEERVSLFVNQSWPFTPGGVSGPNKDLVFRVSHLEIVTHDGLQSFIKAVTPESSFGWAVATEVTGTQTPIPTGF